MDTKMFQEFLHCNCDMTNDILMDRIHKFFNSGNADDIDKQEFNIFLNGLLIFEKVPVIHIF